MKEIKELTDKYFVLKIDDVLRCENEEIVQFRKLTEKIALRRKEEGKGVNSYLVLNLEDDINLNELKIMEYERSRTPIVKIKDIAVDIVNAILKAKNDHPNK